MSALKPANRPHHVHDITCDTPHPCDASLDHTCPPCPDDLDTVVENLLLHASRSKSPAPGRWNVDKRTGALKESIRRAHIKARDAVPALDSIAWAVTRFPGCPYVTDGENSLVQTINLESALEWPYICLDSQTHINSVNIVCPLTSIALLSDFGRKGLPHPTWITTHSDYCNMVWLLGWPVRRSSEKPPPFLAKVCNLLADALCGEATDTVMNPWALATASTAITSLPRWDTFEGGGTLTTLCDLIRPLTEPYGPAISARRHFAHELVNPKGRNWTVFDRTRLWAYDNYFFYKDDLHELSEALFIVARENNKFDGCGFSRSEPLSDGVLATISQRICDFVTHPDFCSKKRCTRGIMGLAGTGLSLLQKRQAAGKYAAAHRRYRTDTDIWEAAVKVRTRGQEVTKRAVIEESGRSARTIDRRWKSLVEALDREPDARPTPPHAPRVVRTFNDTPAASRSRPANRCTSDPDGVLLSRPPEPSPPLVTEISRGREGPVGRHVTHGSDGDLGALLTLGRIPAQHGPVRPMSIERSLNRSHLDETKTLPPAPCLRNAIVSVQHEGTRQSLRTAPCNQAVADSLIAHLTSGLDSKALYDDEDGCNITEIMTLYEWPDISNRINGTQSDATSPACALARPTVSQWNSEHTELTLQEGYFDSSCDEGTDDDYLDSVPDTDVDDHWFKLANELDRQGSPRKSHFDYLRQMPEEEAESIILSAYSKHDRSMPFLALHAIIDSIESCFGDDNCGIEAIVGVDVVLAVDALLGRSHGGSNACTVTSPAFTCWR